MGMSVHDALKGENADELASFQPKFSWLIMGGYGQGDLNDKITV